MNPDYYVPAKDIREAIAELKKAIEMGIDTTEAVEEFEESALQNEIYLG